MENEDFNCEDCFDEFDKQLEQLKIENEDLFKMIDDYSKQLDVKDE